VYLVNCRMWLVADTRYVDGQLYREVVAMKIMISLLDKFECIDMFCYWRTDLVELDLHKKLDLDRVRWRVSYVETVLCKQ